MLAYLIICATLLPKLIHPAHASSIYSEFQVLTRRQMGTYWGDDDDGTSHAGSYHCYHGGTWYKQADIASLWDQACSNTTSITYDIHHFSYAPNADGSYIDQSVKHAIYDRYLASNAAITVCQSEGIVIDFSATFAGDDHANQTECEWAMKRVSETCHGKHNDTRGSWYEFEDGSTYGFDPQGYYDGKEQK